MYSYNKLHSPILVKWLIPRGSNNLHYLLNYELTLILDVNKILMLKNRRIISIFVCFMIISCHLELETHIWKGLTKIETKIKTEYLFIQFSMYVFK